MTFHHCAIQVRAATSLPKGCRARVAVAAGIALICSAGLDWSGPSAFAQAPQPAQPTFRIEANFVRVDVYPTLRGAAVPDLRREEFEVLEDGVPQRIETFEYVVVPPAGPQMTRIEPNTVREANEMAAATRGRVFVLFLDTYHVENEAAFRVKQPLLRLLDRIIGQEDMIGIMTPEMSAANVTFARKTLTLADALNASWIWGRRTDITDRDPEETKYEWCYPKTEAATREIAAEMIARRRERLSLEALEDLVRHLRGVREERKAILTVSDGWLLYRRNPKLGRPLEGYPTPGRTPITISQPGSRLGLGDRGTETQPSLYECDAARLQLSEWDGDQRFREIVDEANRSNATFYPVDPRGLPVFDTPIGPDPPAPLAVDSAMLRQRITSLRTLADATDGTAVVNSNDIESGLTRIAADLSSYYLLGYYSSNSKLDGKYRMIRVRVKRPGVDVRARRGYRAATAEELRPQRSTTAAKPMTPASPVNVPVAAAVGALAAIRPDSALRIRAVTAWKLGEAVIWVVGEVDARAAGGDSWQGGSVQVALEGPAGESLATREVTLEGRTRSFTVPITESGDLKDGEYTVRVRARPGGGLPVSDVARVNVRQAVDGALGDPLYFRRGPTTGAQFQATADLRFRRTERVRIETAVAGPVDDASARFLDRNGQPMAVPVTATVREDKDGTRWMVTEMALTPLAPADYVIELIATRQGKTEKAVAAIKVVP